MTWIHCKIECWSKDRIDFACWTKIVNFVPKKIANDFIENSINIIINANIEHKSNEKLHYSNINIHINDIVLLFSLFKCVCVCVCVCVSLCVLLFYWRFVIEAHSIWLPHCKCTQPYQHNNKTLRLGIYFV